MKKDIPRFTGDEDRFVELDCPESTVYYGKCKRSQCLWLMDEAFKEGN